MASRRRWGALSHFAAPTKTSPMVSSTPAPLGSFATLGQPGTPLQDPVSHATVSTGGARPLPGGRMKLARKLTLFLLLAMCIVLALDAWVGIWRETRLLEKDMRTDQRDTGRALASAIADTWERDGHDRALALVDEANARALQLQFRWVDADGASGSQHRLTPAARADLEKDIPVTQAVRGDDGRDRLLTYVPVRTGGQLRGALQVSESLWPKHQHVRSLVVHRLITTATLAALFGLLATVLGAWLVGRPMHGLVAKARRAGAGDLSGPLAMHQHDEIGELAGEFDAMCERLDAAHRRLLAETTARIAALEQLRHADRLATVGQLAAGVAHELGTPLNVVTQRAKMIATGEVKGTEAADGARIVVEQAQRITGVVRQLLGLARQRTPEKAPQDLRHIAERTLAFLAPLAKKHAVELRLEGDAGPLVGLVDGGQIEQVLTNLVMNAIQSMPAGGQVRVRLGRERVVPPAAVGGPAGDYLRLAVRDGGAGIAPGDLPHIFEPFFTTKDVGEGTGLGLAVADGIVRDHGGWIEVESRQGVGSCFSVSLPAPPPSPAETPATGAVAAHGGQA